MADLSSLPHKLDSKARQCRVIIETLKDGRSKFSYDPESGLFELKTLLPDGLCFPFDFGFIPSTKAPDGDPLDVMVLMDESTHVGCLMDVRLVGVIEATQSEKGKTTRNDRLLAIAIHSHSPDYVKTIDDIGEARLTNIGGFFVTYNKLRGKKFKVNRTAGPPRAVELVQQANAVWQRTCTGLRGKE